MSRTSPSRKTTDAVDDAMLGGTNERTGQPARKNSRAEAGQDGSTTNSDVETDAPDGGKLASKLLAWVRFPFRMMRGKGKAGATQDASDEAAAKWTRAPAFLVSLIVHTVLLLGLLLWRFAAPLSIGVPVDFTIESQNRRIELAPVEMQLALGKSPPPPNVVAETPMQQPSASQSSSSTLLSELLNEKAAESSEQPNQSEVEQLLQASAIDVTASFASTGVEGRSLPDRRKIALARGGTIESEQAVEDAMVWLAEHQRPNGSWSLVHSQGRCNGRCGNDGTKGRFDTAATGLSLLAFLGAGYTHRDGMHRETVRKGVYFLLQVMEETPQGGSFMYQSDRGMYNHGIATFALCEAYQLTNDRDLRDAAQKAIDFIVSAQTYRGGWRYLPGQPGDLTSSGWQIMALKSAYAAGLNVPDRTILRIDTFLKSQEAKDGSFFGYTKPGKSPTCTAIGQMLRLFRGTPRSDPRILEAAGYFRRVGKSNTDVYFNYYVTLFLFHVGDPFWETWNPQVRDHLVKMQSKQGHMKGSWYFDNPYGREGGRLYTTAMAAMTLEVYYRYSPLYQQVDVSFEL